MADGTVSGGRGRSIMPRPARRSAHGVHPPVVGDDGPLDTDQWPSVSKAGRIRDPFDHTWGLAQRVEELDTEEMARRMKAFYEE